MSPATLTPPTRTNWLPLMASCLGTFLLLTYTTIVTVALPRIGADLHAGFGSLQWIVDALTVALAGLSLGMGALSDNLGRKRLYLAGLVLFGVATLGCGLAGSATMLIIGRAAQGVAGAAMFATILPLIALTYHGADRAKAFAAWGTVAGVAGAVGTVAGGLLAEFLGWRWIFLWSLPLCVAAVVLAATSLSESDRSANRLDYAGLATFTVATTSLTFAVIHGGESGWTTPGTLLALSVAAVTVPLFALAERSGRHPMVPLGLFGTRRFVGVLVVAFGYYFATFGAMPIMSLWLQEHVGLSPTATSLLLGAQIVVFFMVSALVSGRLHRLPPGRVLGGATVLIGLGCVTALAVWGWTSWIALVPALLITGMGAGIVSPIFPAVAIAAVPPTYGGTAGAAANSARQLGLAVGIALCGALYIGAGDATHGLTVAMSVCGALALVSGLLSGWLLGTRRVPAGTR